MTRGAQRAAIPAALTAGVLAILVSAGEDAPPLFRDVTERSGVRFVNQASPTSRKYLIESMTGGAAVLDYDNDGLLDIFLVNGAALKDPMAAGDRPDKSAPRYWNRLFRNNGDGTFSDVTEKAGVQGSGYSMGVAAADYDNDGHEDLYVTGLNKNTLYHNNGDGTFSDVTAQSGTGGSGWSTGALFIDYDRDGRLDLVVARYLTWNFSMDIWCGERRPGYRAYCHPDQFQPITHLVFHNEGNGRFKDVSDQTHFARFPGKGLGVAMNDFDRDGWPDIFIANDSVAQQLFRNRGDGTFEEVGVTTGVAYDSDGRAFAGMGADFADYDNDGWPDIFDDALATQRYAVFHNIKGAFDYVSDSVRVAAASHLHSGWGAKFIDYDNDGWRDLFVGQGHVMDNIQLTQPHLRYLEPPLLLRNNKGVFADVSAQAGPAFHQPTAARGVAFGDLNNDGWVDAVINCNNQPAVILENQRVGGNHWLIIDTRGTRSNRDGIGARIRLVTPTGPEQHAIVTTGGSYISSNDKRAHFGLGNNRVAKLIEVAWPSGSVQTLENVAADRIITVSEP
ncbi:MAG TPA: CRTAC1 family protein [Bryobacteraceae bacterium]|nr:CRTAC1 family protein [Bryobacteraceae bacterium]